MDEASDKKHEQYMRRCIELGKQALATRDAPVGALILLNAEVIAEGIEGVKRRRDVTAHAETEALRAACERLGSVDLSGSVLYTTVEPCPMCAYAIRLARVSAVVAGTQSSEIASTCSGRRVLTTDDLLQGRRPPMLIRDVLGAECRALLMRNT